MTTQALSARSPHSRILFFILVGVLAVLGALNAAAALRVDAAEPAATAATADEPVGDEAAPPPPAFVFDTPLPGREINSPFGLRQLPWEENGRLHEGVDIVAATGSPIKAATDGVVVEAGVSGSYGRYVEIAHKDGFRTLYAHLGAVARGVRPGAYAPRGQVIAFVGNSGRSTGAHLHFELRRRGRPLNPSYFLDQTFDESDDLPLKAAARVSRKVRVATVSAWPEGMKAAKARSERARRRAAVADS